MTTQQTSSSPQIHRLTLAVWILIFLVAVNIGISTIVVLQQYVTQEISADFSPTPYPQTCPSSYDDFDGFYEWPLEKQISESSVIAVVRYEKDGDRYKAIISKLLKRDPNVKFFYKERDEYTSSSYYPEEGISHGDGQVIFFVGSPASMRFACTFTGDRIRSFGDIPITEFQRLINEMEVEPEN